MKNQVEALSIAVQAGVPVLLWGSPGTGKTSAITALGEQLGLLTEVVIASIREPADFSGLPIVIDGSVKMAPPAWAKNLAEAGKGLLFLDEISTAPPAVQAALLRVVLDKTVGDLKLPDEISVVAAANPPEEAAGGWDLTPPLANRFCHISWSINPEAWIEGFTNGFETNKIKKLPKDWQKTLRQNKSLISSFIHLRPHLLLQVPKEEVTAWASPRSWEMAAYLMTACDSVNADDDVKNTLVIGCVGEGTGIEFLSWLKDLDLPDPEELLKNPSSFKLPTRGDKAYAVLSSVATAAVENLTKERWMAAWDIFASAAKQGGKDVAAASVRTLAQARKSNLPLPIKQIQEFIPLLKESGLL